MDNIYISNGFCGKRRNVAIDWSSIDGDFLECGTPVSSDGKVSNDESAVGITTRSITRRYATNVDILISGYVDASILAVELSYKCRRALSKIAIVSDGEFVPLDIPSASTTEKGGIMLGDGLFIDEDGACSVKVDAVCG